MRSNLLTAAACIATLAAPTFAQAQFEQFRGKLKEGMYEYSMEMDMGPGSGVPPGMGSQTFQRCVTAQDIEKGTMGKGYQRVPENCEVKDFKMSGNTATYKMACKGKSGGKGPPVDMTGENRITFADNGYDMEMKMAMDQGGRMVNMRQHMRGRYIGPCSGNAGK